MYSWAPTPYSNPEPAEYGYVEQSNGHLHLELPLGEVRNNRSGSHQTQVRLVYDSNFWYPNNFGGETAYSWTPGTTWHVLPQEALQTYGADNAGNNVEGGTDQDGVQHQFTCQEYCYSTEGRGVWVDEWGVYGPDGSDIVSFEAQIEGNSYSKVRDPNGNYIVIGDTLPEVYAESGWLELYDTSNIPFFYWYETAESTTGNNPLYQDFYTLTNMNAAGANASYTATWVGIQVTTDFQSKRVPVAECSNCSIPVISKLTLPDNTSYTFTYDCDSTLAFQAQYCNSPGGESTYYGGLAKMTTPQGGVYTYSYVPFLDSFGDASLVLKSRSNGSGTWTYSQSAVVMSCANPTVTGCTQTMTTVEPNGRTTLTTNIININPWPQTELVTDGAGHNLQLTTTQWDFSHPNQYLTYGAADVQKQWETNTLWDSTGASATNKTVYAYDSPETGNITTLQQWGYYPGTSPSFPSTPDVTTKTVYYAPTNSPIADPAHYNITAGGINVINKPSSITVWNSGMASPVSQTTIYYDQYGASGLNSVTGVTNHDDASYGSNQLVRGNPTSISKWVTGNQYATSSLTYDTTGQVTSSVDGNLNLTTYNYADKYYVDNGTSTPTAYSPPTPTHAYATTVTLPTVHGKSFVTNNGYYYGNQKPAFQTDANGNSSYYRYADPLDRLTHAVSPLGWALTQYTSPNEIDVYRSESVSGSTPSTSCTGCLHTGATLDNLGRVTETTGADGAKVDTAYNTMGLVQSISNPYFTVSDPTYGVKTYAYDILGRLCMQDNPDNTPAALPTCSAKGSSAVQFSYTVNGGSKIDENGNQWIYLENPLRRLSSVTEPNGTITQYGYDILGNLMSITQPSQQRTFTYDGLSRLVTSANPESGTVCYGQWSGSTCSGGYDGNGNVLYKTDARAVVSGHSYGIGYTYDAWNRVISKSYSDGATPISCYEYDVAGLANSIGHLGNAWTQPAGTTCTGSTQSGFAPVAGQFLTMNAITAYDAMGRETSEQQCTPWNCTAGNTYGLGYTYDLAGHLASVTNSVALLPGGTTPLQLIYSFDSSGRQYNLTSNWAGTTYPSTLFNAPSFYPGGAWKNATYGSNLSLLRAYDTRFRILSETDTGSARTSATGGSATVTIVGTEQKQ